MVSVCATCKGLQKHLHGLNGGQDSGTESLVWVNTTLPNLRSSSSTCRACALLVNGILLHHDRFAAIHEDRVRVTAETFNSKLGGNLQDHLSVELRWKESEDPEGCQDDDHEHVASNADLKLDFFTDEVFIARALGFRWLFIDSLCLIQDDVQEKLEDSLKMDEIFGDAVLTIAATSASDSSSQPLLSPKPQPFKVQATDNRGSLYNINVREQPSHYSFKAPFDGNAHMNEWELPFNMTEEANLHTPLLIRAWPYTERLLSPRVLHFTKSEMILECREGYQCECGRIEDSTFDSRPTDQIKREFGRAIAEALNRPSKSNGDNNMGRNRMDSVTNQLASTNLTNGTNQELMRKREETLQLWSYIITEFTARHLTYDSDRLIAIASIAKALSPILQSGYIAGQWTFSTLGLLWYPNDNSRCRRPRLAQGQNVPSWSWASVEGSPIFFDNTSAMDLACRASFGPKGKRASAWSPIMGEPLELSGAMAAEVILHTSSASPSQQQQTPSYTLAKNGMTVDFTPDVVPPRGEDTLQDGETLVCILVSMTFRSSIVGIVLKPSPEGNNTYRRVGRFECYDCTPEGIDHEMSEDAEALFEHWFPEIQDMTQLDNYPQRNFTVI
ncbi:het domain-containing protein [Stemphylium lycopersici]|uniref:Het domain-containing protein n=1 Tax=Stemphylium lycopersici TaxID=183478 RepID=A0A364N5I2_STELY|nr:het domain-containing protein [Stemphylium lycopersici]